MLVPDAQVTCVHHCECAEHSDWILGLQEEDFEVNMGKISDHNKCHS